MKKTLHEKEARAFLAANPCVITGIRVSPMRPFRYAATVLGSFPPVSARLSLSCGEKLFKEQVERLKAAHFNPLNA